MISGTYPYSCFSFETNLRFTLLVHSCFDGYLEVLNKNSCENCRGSLTKQLYNVVCMENSVSRAYIMKIISETRSEHQSRCTYVVVLVEG